MNTKQKLAIAGAGLVVTGIGLSLLGAALITPALVEWTIGVAEKGADRLTDNLERAARRAGKLLGDLRSG